MSHRGKVQLTAFIVAPPDQVTEGERIWQSHAAWMERTHYREGEKALLSYDLSQTPELSDPMDPNSEPTGNTCFVLTEVYESKAGVSDHYEQAEESWGEWEAGQNWLSNCEVRGVQAAEIIHSLW